MARNKKYQVRVSYKVYNYYIIAAKNEQEAIEQALEVSATDSLNDYAPLKREGEAVITMVGNKSVEPEKTATDEIEVLFAVDTEDNVKTSLLAVRANERQNSDKTAAIEQALTEMMIPDEWDDPEEVRADIHQAAEQLAAGWETKVLECYDYEVFWDTVKMV